MNKLWNCCPPIRLLHRWPASNQFTSFSQYCRSTSLLPRPAELRPECRASYRFAWRQPVSGPQRGISTTTATTIANNSTGTNHNLAKDVIIFKYENPRFFKFMNIFACSQFVFWSYLAHFAYTELRDLPVDPATFGETTSWWQRHNLGDQKYRHGMTVLCLGIGYVILALSWLYTLRSVRMLVLRKGGQHVTMVMYGPFGRNRMMNVPLGCVSAQDSRQTAKVVMPLKLKGARMYYMLDMRGEFSKPQLFDQTVGVKRKF